MNASRGRRAGFTLLELLITIVILGVILAVSTPSIKRYLEAQRLRSVSGELSTDLQFARSEAVARKRAVGLKFNADATRTCYTVAAFTGNDCVAANDLMTSCDCMNGIGTACTAGSWSEIKTVILPKSRGVAIEAGGEVVAFDPTSGNMTFCNVNLSTRTPDPFLVNTRVTPGTAGTLETEVVPTGRARTCVKFGKVSGVPLC